MSIACYAKPPSSAYHSLISSKTILLALLFGALIYPGLGVARSSLLPAGAPRPPERSYLPEVVIVKFVQQLPDNGSTLLAESAGKGTSTSPLATVLARHAVHDIKRFAPNLDGPRKAGGTDLSRIYLLHFSSGEDALEVARALAVNPEIEYAEPQFVYELAVIPDDPSYAPEQSAYFERMDLPAAFDDTKGEAGGVVVAIVDGGTDWNHSDLAANVWINDDETLNGLDDDGNGFIDDVRGWNFANNSNDPTGLPATPQSADHGTHVAGIVCAHTNNAEGVAGASWNATYMPVCVASPTADRAVAFGYQGILYAVENGADLINLSWGGPSIFLHASYFEQEVLDFAWENGSVVVAAAGNGDTSDAFFPASYNHVFSVANVDHVDVKVSSSNYGPTIDVAAQGQSIYSTIHGGGYEYLTGTSMASPHAAAVCALVKTKFPGYTPVQLTERVRVTADNIDAVNPGYEGQLGFGRVNAFQALTATTPAVTISGLQIATSDGDEIMEPNETVTLTITVTNQLDAAVGLDFVLGEDSPHATLLNDTASLPALGSLESAPLTSFTLDIGSGPPVDHLIGFTLTVTATSPAYADSRTFSLPVLPVVATHQANKVVTSITSIGKLGFGTGANDLVPPGVGFHYDGSYNLLFEGSLMIGTGAATVSDAIGTRLGFHPEADFMSYQIPAITSPDPPYAEHGIAVLLDAPLVLLTRQDSFEMSAEPYEDFITLSYTIENIWGQPLYTNLYVGLYLDWDIDGLSWQTNRIDFDASRGLGYCWDDSGGPSAYVGVRTLTAPGTTSFRGIWNDDLHPDNPSWGTYGEFTGEEKWESLSGGMVQTAAGPADVSMVIATGPFDLAQGDSLLVAFAIVGGSDLSDLQLNADVAQDLWDNPPTDVAADEGRLHGLPRLAQNVPNPFNPLTTISFDLPGPADVHLRIYDLAGRNVRTLLNEAKDRGSHQVSWDGCDEEGRALASGTYLYRLVTNGRLVTRKMLLLR